MINNKINYPKAISTWLKRFNMNVESLMAQVKHSEEIVKILECSKEYPSWYEFVEICNGLELTLYEFFDEECDVFEGNFKAYNYSFSIREELQRIIDEHHKTAMGISCSMKMPQLAIESILDGSNPDPSMKNVSKILVACNTQLYDFFAQSEFEEFNPRMDEEVKQEEASSEVEENGASSNKEEDSPVDTEVSKSVEKKEAAKKDPFTKNFTREEITRKSLEGRKRNSEHIHHVKAYNNKYRTIIVDNDVRNAIITHFSFLTKDLSGIDVSTRCKWTENPYHYAPYCESLDNGLNITFSTLVKFCDGFHVSLYEFLNPNIREFKYYEKKNSDFDFHKIRLNFIYKKGFKSIKSFEEATNPKCNMVALGRASFEKLRVNTLIAFCDALDIKLWEFFEFQENERIVYKKKEVTKKKNEKKETPENTPVAGLMLQYRRLTLEEKNLFLTMLLAEK